MPKLQVKAWLAIEQEPCPPYAGLMPQMIPAPAGRVSLRVADVAAPVPVFWIARVYPIGVPAGTVAASGVSVRLNAGHCTVMAADAWTGPAFAAVAVAVFESAPQVDAVLALARCAWTVFPDARSPKEQVRVPLAMVQLGLTGLMTQGSPAGSASLRVTAVAVPGPALLTVMV